MNELVPNLVQRLAPNEVRWIHETDELCDGEICFILGFDRILKKEHLEKHRHNIVVHSSNLPKGKGMSPLTWQILEGKDIIPDTLFEAVESLDAGKIYIKEQVEFDGHELIDEMRYAMGKKDCDLCVEFIKRYPEIIATGKEQVGDSTYYKKRTPDDSELDINKSIKEQFNLLRTVDNENYPAFFKYKGHKYVLKIFKAVMTD
jgi:methionyl-tRNA formyltransferase